ncbi:MAG: hypothetical protein E7068_01185 [Lentimicrobiaceae bacterium]|nr:hypothetical protein [Lentimicrobiaceae bacterium]MBQ4547729.1 hypothetical protein [Bacteroidales bacterium]
MRYLWISLIFLSFFSTCQKEKVEDKGEVIVSVYGKKLYKTDLENIVYDGISYNDSVLRAKVYIDKWVHNQLLIRQAENNLKPEQLDFSKRLEEYRNSLVINKYETELINQNLDTEVTEDQIYDYYKNNSGEFRLNRDIVKVASVTLPKDSKRKWVFTKWIRNYDTLMVDTLTYLANKYALEYDFNIKDWRDFEDVANIYNLKIKDNKSFLSNKKYFVVNDDETYTLVKICEYRLVGDESPCEMETDRIKYIILTNRKKALLENLYKDLHSKAIQDNALEVF